MLPVLERLHVGQKLLLAVAWVCADEKRLFERIPEVLMIDVTYDNNGEGRPLGLTACLDPDMRSFTPLRAAFGILPGVPMDLGDSNSDSTWSIKPHSCRGSTD